MLKNILSRKTTDSINEETKFNPSHSVGYIESIHNVLNSTASDPYRGVINGQDSKKPLIEALETAAATQMDGFAVQIKDPTGGRKAMTILNPRPSQPSPYSYSSGKLSPSGDGLGENEMFMADISFTGRGSHSSVLTGVYTTILPGGTTAYSAQTEGLNDVAAGSYDPDLENLVPLGPLGSQFGQQVPGWRSDIFNDDIDPKTGKPIKRQNPDTRNSVGGNARTGTIFIHNNVAGELGKISSTTLGGLNVTPRVP
jgi:hypothetical protein